MSRAWLIENNGVVGVISHVRKAASQTEVTLVTDHLLQLLYYLPDLWSEGLGSSHTWTGAGVQIEISISSKTSIATQKCGLDVPFDSIYLSVNGNNNGTEIHDLGRIIDLKQCRK